METIDCLCRDLLLFWFYEKNIKAIQLSPVKIRQIFPHHCSAKAQRAHELSDLGDGSRHTFVYPDISTSR